jgi:hypothetical protein
MKDKRRSRFCGGKTENPASVFRMRDFLRLLIFGQPLEFLKIHAAL